MSGVWMYREGEAKLFASPDDVPAGEGWTDSPTAPAAKVEAEAKPKRGRSRKTAPDESVSDDDSA